MPRSILFAALLLSAASCGPRTAPDLMGRGSVSAGSSEVAVVVENDNFDDFEVFLDRDGGARRLGVVTGKDRQRFVLDRAVFSGTGQLRIQLRSMGAGRESWRSPPVLVNPGQTVVLRVAVELALSRIDVRR